jgi:hypothetical protein
VLVVFDTWTASAMLASEVMEWSFAPSTVYTAPITALRTASRFHGRSGGLPEERDGPSTRVHLTEAPCRVPAPTDFSEDRFVPILLPIATD